MRKLVGHSSDYEDLVQAAAELAVRDLPKFEGRSSLSTWVFRICYTTLLGERRWLRRWLKRFSLHEPSEGPELLDARAENASEALEVYERRRRLTSAVERLTPKLRAVVTLHDLQGMSVEEIAEVVDANVLTVRSRLRDGRRALARRLHKDPYFGEEACLMARGRA
jgi:RNA polymerase sigma-70 factor (ECF subfamily)